MQRFLPTPTFSFNITMNNITMDITMNYESDSLICFTIVNALPLSVFLITLDKATS